MIPRTRALSLGRPAAHDVAVFLRTVTLALATASAAANADPPARIDSQVSLPDPTAAIDGGWIYAFGTGRGIVVRRSKNLYDWEDAGRVFSDAAPTWAKDAVPRASGVWAPDISFHEGLYYLYYSVSTLGSQRSVIGLAVNRTLDRASPLYAWEDRGLVMGSAPKKNNFNAIDPALVVEPDGQWWLFFGSWWTGIKAVRLDPKTGKPRPGADIIPIAARAPGDQPSIEAAYVIRRDGFWYLFVSWGTILPPWEATYEVRVGRSSQVDGPYADAAGRPMLRGGGTRVLGSRAPWQAPGHNGVLHHRDRDWMIHHTFDLRDLRAGRILQVRPMHWVDGWPTVGDPLTGPADE